MINPLTTEAARIIIGKYLLDIRTEKKLSFYAISKKSGLSTQQIQAIETGSKSYTIDSFFSLIHALDCYFFLKSKDNKHLDFEDMKNKATE